MKYKNILIVRTDRIGDVVLTLPLIQVLKKNFPAARISFLVRMYTQDVVQGQPGLDDVILYDRNGIMKPFLAQVSELRRMQFDLAIVAFPRFRVALLLWWVGVTTRVGTGYRWYSLLFNKRVYEHRKYAQKHEYQYNLSLAKQIGCEVDSDDVPRMTISRPALEAASDERKRLGIANRQTVAILHPGSGGSARDWSAARFRSLALRLAELGWKVIVTGAKGEEELVAGIVDGHGPAIKASVGVLSLNQLAAFIQSVDLFISNSTGPLHIAAAVGTPVIGFYPPIVACSPRRWGPVTSKRILFVPENSKCELCHGSPCRNNVCMEQISVEQVVNAALQLVGRRKRTKTSHKISASLS